MGSDGFKSPDLGSISGADWEEGGSDWHVFGRLHGLDDGMLWVMNSQLVVVVAPFGWRHMTWVMVGSWIADDQNLVGSILGSDTN